MGKRGGKRRASDGAAASSGFHTSLSLREEASGKKQSHNAKLMLKLKHLQHLAEWSTREASVSSLGAFFGHRFAELGETLGIPPDRSLFPCQRCETILRPGVNCTVRIEKNRAKRQRRCSRTILSTQNNVVYTCSFCSHRNLKRGTPKGHTREITRSKVKPSLNNKAGNFTARKCDNPETSNANQIGSLEAIEAPSPSINNISASLTDNRTPLATEGAKLLDSKRRKRNKPSLKGSTDESLVSSALAGAEKTSGTSRKRRKSWTSLKEIAASEENERNQRFKNLSIPFLL